MSFQNLPYDIYQLLLDLTVETDPASFFALAGTCRSVRSVYLSQEEAFLEAASYEIIGERNHFLAEYFARLEHPELKDLANSCDCGGERGKCKPEAVKARCDLIRVGLDQRPDVIRFARFIRAYGLLDLRIRRHGPHWDDFDERSMEGYEPTPFEDYVSGAYIYAAVGNLERHPSASSHLHHMNVKLIVRQIGETCLKWVKERWEKYKENSEDEEAEDEDTEGEEAGDEEAEDEKAEDEEENEIEEDEWEEDRWTYQLAAGPLQEAKNFRVAMKMFAVDEVDLDAWEKEANKAISNPHVARAKSLLRSWKRDRQFLNWAPGSPVRLWLESALQKDFTVRKTIATWLDTPTPAPTAFTLYPIPDKLFNIAMGYGPDTADAIFTLAQVNKSYRGKFELHRSYWVGESIKFSLGVFYNCAVAVAQTELDNKKDGAEDGGMEKEERIWRYALVRHRRVEKFARFLRVLGRVTGIGARDRMPQTDSREEEEVFVKALYTHVLPPNSTALIQTLMKAKAVRAASDSIRDSLSWVIQRIYEATQPDKSAGPPAVVSSLAEILLDKGEWRLLERLCGVGNAELLPEVGRLSAQRLGALLEGYRNEWLEGEKAREVLGECLGLVKGGEVEVLVREA